MIVFGPFEFFSQMLVTQETIAFWEIIESDLVTTISAFIKNILYLTGYKDAISIKNLDEDRINLIQKFVRGDMHHCLVKHGVDKQNYVHFYGVEYLNTTGAFEFSSGDKDALLEIAKYVCNIVEPDGEVINKTEISYFKPKTRAKKNQRIDWYMDRIQVKREKVAVPVDDESIDKYKQKLVCKTTDTIQKMNCCSSDELEANKSKISVWGNDENRICGTIGCLWCEKDQLNKKVFVHFRAESQTSYYWIISNFTAHLKNCHGIKCSKMQKIGDRLDQKTTEKKRKRSIPSDEKDAVSLEGPKHTEEIEIDMLKNSAKKVKADLGEKDKIDEQIVEEISMMDIVYENSDFIEEESENNAENVIFHQVSEQIANMQDSAFFKKLNKENMQYDTGEKMEKLEVAKIAKDGNCLLRAVAHQLYDIELGINKQEASTQEIRSKIVSYIKQNLERFKQAIKACHYIKEETDHEYIQYLDTLSKPGEWAGTEALIAISELYTANVIIVNEEGAAYMINDFTFANESCILLAYRLCSKSKKVVKKQARNHYDSIIDINKTQIKHLAKLFSERYLAKLQFDTNKIQTLDDTMEFQKNCSTDLQSFG